MQRLLSDNYYVHRFYMHVFELSGDQMENAIQFIINCFRKRKESGVAGESGSRNQGGQTAKIHPFLEENGFRMCLFVSLLGKSMQICPNANFAD